MTRRLAVGLLAVATMSAGRVEAQLGWSPPNATPPPDMPIQAWVLTSDGTALARVRPA
jgi:hypothetical protein